MNNTTECINSYDVLRAVGAAASDAILVASWQGGGHERWTYWSPGGMRVGQKRSDDFNELTQGRPFVFMSAGKYIGAWVAEELRDRIVAANLNVRGRLKFSDPGHPCSEYVGGHGRGDIPTACERPALPGTDLCSMHTKVQDRREAKRAAWQEKWDAQRAADQHEAEARRRSEELVAEAAPLLEQLGIRPDTVTVARSGLVELPSEVFDVLLRKAAEMAEMEGMGL